MVLKQQQLPAKEIQKVKLHVAKWTKTNDAKAWRIVLLTIFMEFFALCLFHYQFIKTAIILRAFVLLRLFILLHHTAHSNVFSSLEVNKFFGIIFGIYCWFPYDFWRAIHNKHHQKFGDIDDNFLIDPITLTKKDYDKMKGPVKFVNRFFREPVVNFLFTGPAFIMVAISFLTIKVVGLFAWSTVHNLLTLILTFYIYPCIGLKWEHTIISVYLYSIFLWIGLHLNHSVNPGYRSRGDKWDHERATIIGSTHVPTFWLIDFFAIGQLAYHHVHHLNTHIPIYMLQECHKRYGNENWKKLKVEPVSPMLAFKSLANSMYDEETEKLIPFDYS